MSRFTVTLFGAYPHKAQTFARNTPPIRTSEADWKIVSERKHRQKVPIIGNVVTCKIPSNIGSFLK